jgi:hypothetical protein
MGCHGVVSEGSHVPEWRNRGQSDVKSYLFLVSFAAGVNSEEGEFCDGLDLEGVYCDTMLGNDEPKEVSSGDAEYTLEGIQADIVLTTPVKDNV